MAKKAQHDQPIIGVNLGGWLVLEKWITPSLFTGLKAADEFNLSNNPSPAIRTAIRKHRDTFITRDDFVWLKKHGVKSVRIPIGYWAFGDEEPYDGTIEYLDKAFDWAQDTGIRILIDLHGAPGSQNGWDHSGQSGRVGWHKDERNIVKTLAVIGKLAKRYAGRNELLGFELLNEPGKSVPRRYLIRYYDAAYRVIRAYAGQNVWIVFHDAFRPRRFSRVLRGREYSNVFIDTHHYQVFKKKDKRRKLHGHIRHALTKLPKRIARMRRGHPVIIGEWSMALDPRSLRGIQGEDVETAVRVFGAAQILGFRQAHAWFYWNYKTEDPASTWNFKSSVERGLLPVRAVSRKTTGTSPRKTSKKRTGTPEPAYR